MATKKANKPKENIIVDTYFPDDDVFNDWKENYIQNMKDDNEDYEAPDDTDLYEKYYEDVEMWIGDEKMNLNKEINGIIMAFANLGFWNGRKSGAKQFTDNINSIIWADQSCDYFKIYADRYNIKGQMSHHDGTHYLLYRIAPNYEIAEEIMNRADRGELTEEYFKRKTKSLRKYVANIYGW